MIKNCSTCAYKARDKFHLLLCGNPENKNRLSCLEIAKMKAANILKDGIEVYTYWTDEEELRVMEKSW